MSDFWMLWNKAETGDYAALWEVNVLVAEKAGLKIYRAGTIDADAVPGYAEGIGWLQEWISNDTGEAAPIPDYMNDLNAAAGLTLPDDVYVTSKFKNGRWYCEIMIWIDGDSPQEGDCNSSSEARARVGAWWAAVTGEVKP